MHDEALVILVSGSPELSVPYDQIEWIKVKSSRLSGPIIKVYTNTPRKFAPRVSVYYGSTEVCITPDHPESFVAEVEKRVYHARRLRQEH